MRPTVINRQQGVIGFITVIILAILVFNVIAVGFTNTKLENDKSIYTYGDYAPASSNNPPPDDPSRIQKDLNRQIYVDYLGKVVQDYYRANAKFLDSALDTSTQQNNARAIIKSDLLRILNNVEIKNDVKVTPLQSVNIYVSNSMPSGSVFYRKIMVWVEGKGEFLNGPRSASEASFANSYAGTTPPIMNEGTSTAPFYDANTGAILGCQNFATATVPNPNATYGTTTGTGYSLQTTGTTTIPVTAPFSFVPPTSTTGPYRTCDPTRYYMTVVSGLPIQLEYYRQTAKKLDYIAFKFAAFFKFRQNQVPFKDPEINYFRPLGGTCATTTSEPPCLDSYTNINLSSVAYVKGLANIAEGEALTQWGDSILLSNSPPLNYPWTMQIRAPLPWKSGGVQQFIDITAVQQL